MKSRNAATAVFESQRARDGSTGEGVFLAPSEIVLPSHPRTHILDKSVERKALFAPPIFPRFQIATDGSLLVVRKFRLPLHRPCLQRPHHRISKRPELPHDPGVIVHFGFGLATNDDMTHARQ